MGLFNSTPNFYWSANSDGLAIRFSSPKLYANALIGRGDTDSQLGLIRMQMLTEIGEAQIKDIDSGIFIQSADAVRLDLETRQGFLLPEPWPGGMRLTTSSVPQSSTFSARLGLVDIRGNLVWDWQLRGPILECGSESFLPTPPQYASLLAFKVWQQSEPKDEITNLGLLATIREARLEGCPIDLGAYADESGVAIGNANDIAIGVREDKKTGGLILLPVLEGNFPQIDMEQIEERLSQLNHESERSIIRVGKTIILLNDIQTRQAKAIKEKGRLDKTQRIEFQRDPSRWLAENVFVGIPGEFSPRVLGLEFWTDLGLGPQDPSEIDWTIQKPEPEKIGTDSTGCVKLDKTESIVNQIVVTQIADNIRKEYGLAVPSLGQEPDLPFEPNFSDYKRPPKNHQIEAVKVLLAHAKRAYGYPKEGGGAVLADDMGLGKTYSALLFLAEWIKYLRSTEKEEPRAILIVAPLTLIENWQQEVNQAFHNPGEYFQRIVNLHPDHDLQRFRDNEIVEDKCEEDADGKPTLIRPALIYGQGGVESLDKPGSLVLVTYDTLRRYRLSLAQCNWGVVIFDEAQALKNPNAIQTITAKSLKAQFRLIMTGTPIENGLRDFWCLFDAAEPGLLKTWPDFQKSYVKPLLDKVESPVEVLDRLKNQVGALLLRRMKEDKLEGLPKKNIILRKSVSEFDGQIVATMSGVQLELYDQARGAGLKAAHASQNDTERQRHFLSALWNLREAVLHPALVGGKEMPLGKNPAECETILKKSAKIAKVLEILEQIKSKKEKVLIFAIGKNLQRGLAANLSRIYGIQVPVINGDTPASSKNNSENTRLGLLSDFLPEDPLTPKKPKEFRVAVLSPIAAGVGLTLTGANHVIHLERHWNPAKEAQATDRVYRIGQDKEVYVWVPILLHPSLTSFDENLNSLIEKKASLHHALSIPEAVTENDIFGGVFGSTGEQATQAGQPLNAEDISSLSGYEFEALVAELFAREGASEVILTPEGSDHGCDVVLIGAGGRGGDNWLIQCKHTNQAKLSGDMPVREIVGSRWHYENSLKHRFDKLVVVTSAKKLGADFDRSAKGQKVDVFSGAWVAERVKKHGITREDTMAWGGRRTRVG
jgi:SNF2 family DNA or RNA helicase